MFKWIKKLFSRSAIENNDQIPGKRFLRDPALWRFNRETIARATAIGLLVAFIPIMPFQMFLAALLAILLQANLPIALAVSWVNNPITLVPIVYFTSAVGEWILGEHENPVQTAIHDIAWELGLTSNSVFTSWIVQFGKKYFVGLPFVAIGAALLGYLLVILFWYLYQLFKKFNAN